jgi:hypothetical protein
MFDRTGFFYLSLKVYFPQVDLLVSYFLVIIDATHFKLFILVTQGLKLISLGFCTLSVQIYSKDPNLTDLNVDNFMVIQ